MEDLLTEDDPSAPEGRRFTLSMTAIIAIVGVIANVAAFFTRQLERRQAELRARNDVNAQAMISLDESMKKMDAAVATLRGLAPAEMLEKLKQTGGLRD
jgi:sensor domain CHASE-containing protein